MSSLSEIVKVFFFLLFFMYCKGDPCDFSTCGDHGVCISKAGDDTKYTCNCDEGFQSPYCTSTESNHCLNSPPVCLNNGVCLDVPSAKQPFTCECQPPFAGSTCDIQVFCRSKEGFDICTNGGICDLVKGVCSCQDGFLGVLCQFPIPTIGCYQNCLDMGNPFLDLVLQVNCSFCEFGVHRYVWHFVEVSNIAKISLIDTTQEPYLLVTKSNLQPDSVYAIVCRIEGGKISSAHDNVFAKRMYRTAPQPSKPVCNLQESINKKTKFMQISINCTYDKSSEGDRFTVTASDETDEDLSTILMFDSSIINLSPTHIPLGKFDNNFKKIVKIRAVNTYGVNNAVYINMKAAPPSSFKFILSTYHEIKSDYEMPAVIKYFDYLLEVSSMADDIGIFVTLNFIANQLQPIADCTNKHLSKYTCTVIIRKLKRIKKILEEIAVDQKEDPDFKTIQNQAYMNAVLLKGTVDTSIKTKVISSFDSLTKKLNKDKDGAKETNDRQGPMKAILSKATSSVMQIDTESKDDKNNLEKVMGIVEQSSCVLSENVAPNQPTNVKTDLLDISVQRRYKDTDAKSPIKVGTFVIKGLPSAKGDRSGITNMLLYKSNRNIFSWGRHSKYINKPIVGVNVHNCSGKSSPSEIEEVELAEPLIFTVSETTEVNDTDVEKNNNNQQSTTNQTGDYKAGPLDGEVFMSSGYLFPTYLVTTTSTLVPPESYFSIKLMFTNQSKGQPLIIMPKWEVKPTLKDFSGHSKNDSKYKESKYFCSNETFFNNVSITTVPVYCEEFYELCLVILQHISAALFTVPIKTIANSKVFYECNSNEKPIRILRMLNGSDTIFLYGYNSGHVEVNFHISMISNWDIYNECSGNGNISETIEKKESQENSSFPFSLSTSSMSCFWWNSEEQDWVQTGCEAVYQLEDGEWKLACSCSHLSVLSAGVFVAPNKLNPVEDIILFYTFFQNPVTIVVVCICWILYILILIWARRKDKLSFRKTGLTYLYSKLDEPGNENSYFYIMTVMTGWKFLSGTTAHVFINVIGKNGCSGHRCLSDLESEFNSFEPGSENWFILRTAECLGDIVEIEIWTDLSGKYPTWYLNCIFIRDLNLNKEWFFKWNNWLTPDIPDTLLLKLKCDEKTVTSDTLVFHTRVQATQAMRDKHMWLSIFNRPNFSSFTSVQRLACGITFLCTSMMVNIMFNGIVADPEDQENILVIKLDLAQIAIGIESALISTILTTPLLEGFRYTRQYHSTGKLLKVDKFEKSARKGIGLKVDKNFETPKKVGKNFSDLKNIEKASHNNVNSKSAEKNKQSMKPESKLGEAPNQNMKTKLTKTNPPKKKGKNTIKNQKDIMNKNSNAIKDTNFKNKSEDLNERENNDENLKGIHTTSKQNHSVLFLGDKDNNMHSGQIMGKQRKNLVQVLKYNCNLNNGSQLMSNNTNNSNESSRKKRKPQGGENIQTSSQVDKGKLQDNVKNKSKTKKVKSEITANRDDKKDDNGKLFSGKKEIGNTTESTEEKENQREIAKRLPPYFVYVWYFIAFTASLVCSFFVMLYGLSYGYTRSFAWAVAFFSGFAQSSFIIQPIRSVAVTAFFVYLFKVHTRTLGDDTNIVLSADGSRSLFINRSIRSDLPVGFPSISRINLAKFRLIRLNHAIKTVKEIALDLLLLLLLIGIAFSNTDANTFWLNTNLNDNFINGNFFNAMKLKQVKSVDQIWDYMDSTIIPYVYTGYRFSADFNTLVNTKVTMRQLRVKKGMERFRRGIPSHQLYTIDRAFTDWSWSNNERSNYTYFWQKTTKKSPDGWYYKDYPQVSFFDITKLSGIRKEGYEILLPYSPKKATETLKKLRDSSWLDEASRYLSVEVSLFHVPLAASINILIQFKISAVGVVEPYASIWYNNLQLFNNPADLYVVVCYIGFATFLMLSINSIVKRMRQEKREFFQSVTNTSDFLIAILCAIVLITFALKVVTVYNISPNADDHTRFFQTLNAAIWHYLLVYILSVLIFFVILHTVILSGLHRRILFVFYGIKLSISHILAFSALLAWLIFVFGQIASKHILAGCEDFSSLFKSVTMLLNIFMLNLNHSLNFNSACLSNCSAQITSFYIVLIIYVIFILFVFIPFIRAIFIYAITVDAHSYPLRDYAFARDVLSYIVNIFWEALGFVSLPYHYFPLDFIDEDENNEIIEENIEVDMTNNPQVVTLPSNTKDVKVLNQIMQKGVERMEQNALEQFLENFHQEEEHVVKELDTLNEDEFMNIIGKNETFHDLKGRHSESDFHDISYRPSEFHDMEERKKTQFFEMAARFKPGNYLEEKVVNNLQKRKAFRPSMTLSNIEFIETNKVLQGKIRRIEDDVLNNDEFCDVHEYDVVARTEEFGGEIFYEMDERALEKIDQARYSIKLGRYFERKSHKKNTKQHKSERLHPFRPSFDWTRRKTKIGNFVPVQIVPTLEEHRKLLERRKTNIIEGKLLSIPEVKTNFKPTGTPTAKPARDELRKLYKFKTEANKKIATEEKEQSVIIDMPEEEKFSALTSLASNTEKNASKGIIQDSKSAQKLHKSDHKKAVKNESPYSQLSERSRQKNLAKQEPNEHKRKNSASKMLRVRNGQSSKSKDKQTSEEKTRKKEPL